MTRVAIRNRVYATTNYSMEAGYLEDGNGMPKYILEYHHSSFIFWSVKCVPISSDETICSECMILVNDLRRRCYNRYLFNNKPIDANTRHSYIVSTPSAVMEYCDKVSKQQKKQYDKIRYLKRYNQRLNDHGISIPIESATKLFDDTDLLADGLKQTVK